jgi:hypothetical protein
MTNLPPDPDRTRDTNASLQHESPPSTPRWVKVFGIVALILVLLVVIVMFTGVGGEHGPGRHFRSGNAGGSTPSIEDRVQEP